MPAETRSFRRIALVGNAEPAGDLAAAVDGADLVVRLNGCSWFRTGLTGARTDLLCIRSFGEIGRRFAQGDTPIDPQVAAACSKLWCVGETGNWAPAIVRRYRLGSRPMKLFTLRQMQAFDRQLDTFGSQPHHGASLGAMAVAFLLEAFPGAGIVMHAFGFEGWEGHPWRQEKRYVMFHQYRGNVVCDSLPRLADRVPVLVDGPTLDGPVRNADGEPVSMNDMGRYIAGRLDAGLSFARLCDAIRAELADAPDDMERDLAAFLFSLEDRGALRWEDRDPG